MRKIENDFITHLAALYDAAEAKEMARALLQDLFKCDLTYLITHSPLQLSPEQQSWLDSALFRLTLGEPLQYVEGKVFFSGFPFAVRPGVLIPRPETAELVDWVVDDFNMVDSPSILDVGTGSGCIAVSLAKRLPKAHVSAVDVSDEAYEVATHNAQMNDVPVKFYLLDILLEEPDGLFSAIVSNPPYICEAERGSMRSNVLDFEPSLALFVPDDDPLLFYRRIAQIGLEHLVPQGLLYFEINERFGAQTVALLHELGYADVQLRSDFFGKERMVRARRV